MIFAADTELSTLVDGADGNTATGLDINCLARIVDDEDAAGAPGGSRLEIRIEMILVHFGWETSMDASY